MSSKQRDIFVQKMIAPSPDAMDISDQLNAHDYPKHS
jgi:hypothetical protein